MGCAVLKVLCVVDKEGTALDRLAQQVAPYHDNIDYAVLAVHPKRPDDEQLTAFEALGQAADVIDFQYFRTAEMLRQRYPWLEQKVKALTHNNPYSIYEQDWAGYQAVVGNNRSITKELEKWCKRDITYIPITVDTDFWAYNDRWEPSRNVIMVANRIEPKKGILPVATACGDLGLRLVLVGQVSDREYMHSIMQTGSVMFHEQISDAQLRELYYGSAVHVCNSADNFESGTMPVLEAMLCGTPVLARKVGHVPDLDNGENMVIQPDEPDAVETITQQLSSMLAAPDKLQAMRAKAWDSAKVHSAERRAYAYQVLWRKLLGERPVSVIVPVYERPDLIRKCLEAISAQTYPNIEVVIADDNYETPNYELVREYRKYTHFPVRYLWTGAKDDYGLARARNEAAIEATGEVLVFCDQRQIMEPEAIRKFVDNLAPGKWLWGEKAGIKKDFVENFSCVERADFLRFGGFNERMRWYGGLSQETRHRLKLVGLRAEYCPEAKATPGGKSSNRNKKRGEIIKSKNRLWKMGF